MEEIRAFVAIELPGEVKSALAALQAQLRSGGHHPVKWVDPESVHLTLKFLGNIPASRAGDIIKAMQESTLGIPPFSLEVTGLGVFPNTRKVRVVWVGLGGETDVLNRLQQRIESNLVPLGFACESRPFSPHLTLCRARESISPAEQQNLGQLVSTTACNLQCRFDVVEISLMRSQLTPGGAIYHRLGAVKLDKPLAKNN